MGGGYPYSTAEGILAEYRAGVLMQEKGYAVVARNVNYPKVGELDLVCLKGKLLVVVEVKYRSGDEAGDPIEAVTPSKIKKICRATEKFIAENSFYDYDVRFDVISFRDGVPEHIEDAFYGVWGV